jgi:hypothetical protein
MLEVSSSGTDKITLLMAQRAPQRCPCAAREGGGEPVDLDPTSIAPITEASTDAGAGDAGTQGRSLTPLLG